MGEYTNLYGDFSPHFAPFFEHCDKNNVNDDINNVL